MLPQESRGDAPGHGVHLCDRDLVNVYPERGRADPAVQSAPGDGPGGLDIRPDEKPFLEVVREALGLKKLRVVTTGGDPFEQEREQWDDGNNVVALEPGVVVAYNRNVAPTPSSARKASRSSRSPARSWGGGAVVATA